MNAAAQVRRPAERRTRWLAIGVLLVAAGYQLSFINQPFERNAEGCGAFFGLLARNYFRYPWEVSHAIPIMSSGQGAPPCYYANHPPATPLLIAGLMQVAGYHGDYDRLPPTWTIRLPTVLATLGCGWLIFVILKNRVCQRAGVLALALFLSLPICLMYGGFPDVISPQICLGVLLTLAAYEQMLRRPTWRNAAWLCGAFLTAGLIDWPAFYLLPVLAAHCIATQPVRRWPPFITFGLFGTALFATEYAYLTTAQPDWRWMVTQVIKRSADQHGDSAGAFTFVEWCRQALLHHAIGRHSLIVVLLAVLWTVGAVIHRFRRCGDRLVGLLLGWALLHVLIGRQGVYQHEWWWWPLSPGLAMAAALTLESWIELMAKRLPSPAVFGLAGLAVGVLATRNTLRIIDERNEPSLIEPNHVRDATPGPLNYTLFELGQVVRQHVPADAPYLITENDLSLASWYYCDRAARRRIWDIETFELRYRRPGVDLSFDLYAEWDASPARMIVPKVYAPYVADLLHYLDNRYPKIDLSKFIIYDLGQTR